MLEANASDYMNMHHLQLELRSFPDRVGWPQGPTKTFSIGILHCHNIRANRIRQIWLNGFRLDFTVVLLAIELVDCSKDTY